MSTPYQSLFQYHFLTAIRLIELASRLDEAAVRENPGYGRGSIRDVLFHLLNTDRSWRTGLETGQQPPPLSTGEFMSLADLKNGFEREQQDWQALLTRLTPQEIEDSAQISNRRGRSMPVPRWRVLQHVLLHGMQHQAELAQQLTARGQSPGDLDFIFFHEA